MAERSYPFVGGSTTDAEFSAMFVAVFHGVLNGLAVTADSSGLNVKLQPGKSFVRGHFYTIDTVKTLPIVAGESYPRIDTVVLRLEYGSVKSITPIVKKGVAAASGASAPSLEQTETAAYELPLFDIPVPSGAVTIPASAPVDRRLTWKQSMLNSLFTRDELRAQAGIFAQSTQPTYGDGVIWVKRP